MKLTQKAIFRNKYWKLYHMRLFWTQKFMLDVIIYTHKTTFSGITACSLTLFTPTFQYFYTDIFAIYVTFCNSVTVQSRADPISNRKSAALCLISYFLKIRRWEQYLAIYHLIRFQIGNSLSNLIFLKDKEMRRTMPCNEYLGIQKHSPQRSEDTMYCVLRNGVFRFGSKLSKK